MFVLVLGQSKAGKSRYAEDLSVRLNRGRLLYAATMIPVGEGEAGAACVRRHRAQRAGLGFETIEQPLDVSAIDAHESDSVLLEDVSNLLANGLFCAGEALGADETLQDILALRDKAGLLVAVSFAGLEQGPEFDGPTNHYIAELERLNGLLLGAADRVVMLEAGTARPVKGELP